MSKPYFFLFSLFLVFAFFLPEPAMAEKKSKIKAREVAVSFFRNGENIELDDADAEEIKDRLVDIFNEHSASTAQVWLKQDLERHGTTLKEKWEKFKTGSYFLLTFEEKSSLADTDLKALGIDDDDAETEGKKEDKRPKVKLRRGPEVSEVLLTITEDPSASLIGTLMARLKDSDEIRGYETEGIYIVNLLCLDKAQKYLPEHYNILYERYADPEYENTDINCTSEE